MKRGPDEQSHFHEYKSKVLQEGKMKQIDAETEGVETEVRAERAQKQKPADPWKGVSVPAAISILAAVWLVMSYLAAHRENLDIFVIMFLVLPSTAIGSLAGIIGLFNRKRGRRLALVGLILNVLLMVIPWLGLIPINLKNPL